MLVSPAILMLETCAVRSATVRAVKRHLAVDADALRNLDAAEIKRQHQRQQHGEFDGGDAVLVAGKPRDAADGIQPGDEGAHGGSH